MRRIFTLVAALSLTAGACGTPLSERAPHHQARDTASLVAPDRGAATMGRPNHDPAVTLVPGAPIDPAAAGPPNGQGRLRAAPFPGRAGLRRDIARYLSTRPGEAGLIVSDLRTGVTFGYRPRARFVAASVMKVDILAALLLRRQGGRRGLSPTERATAAQMIRFSDNSAADELYEKVGRGPGIGVLNRQFRLRDTVPARTAWGASLTSPADQLRLLRALTTARSPLKAANQRFVLTQMASVTRAQAWGVRAGAGPEDSVAVKNGWTPLRHQGTGWAVNSIGRIRDHSGRHDFLIAVCTTGSPAQATGIATVEQLVRRTASALRRV
jgi:beta-lactamase class A